MKKEFESWWLKQGVNKFPSSKQAVRLARESYLAGYKQACDDMLDKLKGEQK